MFVHNNGKISVLTYYWPETVYTHPHHATIYNFIHCGHFFGNVRDKTSNITRRYATHCRPVSGCKLMTYKCYNDLEWLFHVKILFRPARLSRAYLCVSYIGFLVIHSQYNVSHAKWWRWQLHLPSLYSKTQHPFFSLFGSGIMNLYCRHRIMNDL